MGWRRNILTKSETNEIFQMAQIQNLTRIAKLSITMQEKQKYSSLAWCINLLKWLIKYFLFY